MSRAMQTHFRLYEVEEVVLDQGFRLRDLWTGGSPQVKERVAFLQQSASLPHAWPSALSSACNPAIPVPTFRTPVRL
jgi:hypothetical protein